MPDNIFDWVDEETRAKAIAEAEEAYASGDYVEHDEAKLWMLEMIDAIKTGKPVPGPPKPRNR